MPMTVEHDPTEQETALYNAMKAGEWDTVDQILDDARNSDQKPPTTPPPKGWKPPAATVAEDRRHAWARYQDEHETPQTDRETATAAAVEAENEAAAD